MKKTIWMFVILLLAAALLYWAAAVTEAGGLRLWLIRTTMDMDLPAGVKMWLWGW